MTHGGDDSFPGDGGNDDKAEPVGKEQEVQTGANPVKPPEGCAFRG